MRSLCIIILLCIGTVSFAQVSVSPLPVEESISVITEKNKTGIYKAQKVKGKITGSGLLVYNNGDIYIGDFNDKLPHGKGMVIASENDSISNCPAAKYYVGKLKNGLKQGKGACYNINGELIYSGKFVDDCPVDDYANNLEYITYFADTNTPDFYYIGEFAGDLPNGFGALFFTDGSILISHFADGSRKGISVYIEHDGNWMTENVDGENTTPISSSEEYTSLIAQSKAAFRAGLKEAFGYLTQAVESGVQVAAMAKGLNGAGNMYSPSSESYSSGSIAENTHTSTSPDSHGDKYNMSEQRSYNSDKSTYAKYDSMLSNAFAGNRGASDSEIKSWQSKMRNLRKKWEDKGKSFPHSSNEDR